MLNTNTKTTQGLTSKRSRMTLNAKVTQNASDKERIRMFYLAYQIHTSNCSVYQQS